jgi:excinuclease UvrABC nuclease subunit
MWVKVDITPWGKNRDDIPPAPGVYAFVRAGRVVYVGQSTNLRKRLASYAYRWSEGRWRIDPRIDGCVVKVSRSRRYGDWLMREARLIRRLRPKYNVAGKESASA